MAKRVEGCSMSVYTYMDLLSILGIGGAHPGGIKATDIMLGGEPIGHQTVILDAYGKVVYNAVGSLTYEKLEELIQTAK